MAVIRIARHGAGADHEAFPGGDRQADFDAELVGRAGLALGDACQPRGVPGVEFVLVLALSGVQLFGTTESLGQFGRRGRSCRKNISPH